MGVPKKILSLISRKLKRHVVDNHHGFGDSALSPNSCIVKRRKMRCALCGDSVLRERRRVAAHLREEHAGMSLKKYK